MLKKLSADPTHEREIIEIPVDMLSNGRYVSQLDRPWIDSPFSFSGFEIESAEEAQELRAHVMQQRPAAKPAEPTSTSLDEISRNITARMHLVPGKDPVPLKNELLSARVSTWGINKVR